MASALLRRAPFRKSLGSGPPFKRGLPTRRRMLSGGPQWLIVRGSPGRGLEIAISWVSACSRTVRTACLPTRHRMLSGGPTWLVVKGCLMLWLLDPAFRDARGVLRQGPKVLHLPAQRQGSKVDCLRLSARQGAECCVVCAAPRVEGAGVMPDGQHKGPAKTRSAAARLRSAKGRRYRMMPDDQRQGSKVYCLSLRPRERRSVVEALTAPGESTAAALRRRLLQLSAQRQGRKLHCLRLPAPQGAECCFSSALKPCKGALEEALAASGE